MSQEEISANMNPPNIHGEPSAHDEVMNLQEKPDHGKETSLSSMFIFGENNNNGLLFAPTYAPLALMRTSISCRPKKVFAPMD